MLHPFIARRLSQRGTLALLFCLAAAAAFAQSGCTTLSEWVDHGFKVGPDYSSPPAPVPTQWIDAKDPKVKHGDPNLCTWWDVFDDPILTKLLHDSYANNLTIRAAGSQILQAQIARDIAKSELLPQAQNAILGYTRNMASRTGGSPIGPGPSFGTALAPAAVLSPVTAPSTPIAGATPSGTGTTTSAVEFRRHGHRFTWWRRCFHQPVLQQPFHFSERILGTRFLGPVPPQPGSRRRQPRSIGEQLRRTAGPAAGQRRDPVRGNPHASKTAGTGPEKRRPAGTAGGRVPEAVQGRHRQFVPRLLPAQVEPGQYQGADPAAGDLPAAGQQPAVHPPRTAGPRLATGTGRRHVARPDPMPRSAMVHIPQPKDASVVVGIPGEFLLRRPDVQAAENQLKIQSAQIGIAEAEMFPHIGINGSIGLASDNFKSCSGPIGHRQHRALADVEHLELRPTPRRRAVPG